MEARAALSGGVDLAGPGLLDLDARQFIALVEGVLRESEGHAETIDKLYASSTTIAGSRRAAERRAAEADRRSVEESALSRAERISRIEAFTRRVM